MSLSTATQERFRNILTRGGISDIPTSRDDLETLFKKTLAARLRELDVRASADGMNMGLNFEDNEVMNAAAILITELDASFADRRKAAIKITEKGKPLITLYWHEMRQILARADIIDIPPPPESPEDLFKKTLATRLRELDVRASADGMNMGLNFEDNEVMNAAAILITELGANFANRRDAAIKITEKGKPLIALHWHEMRQVLARADINNIPPPPESPESLFKKTLAVRLRELNIRAPTDGSGLTNLKPNDLTSAARLIEHIGTFAERLEAAQVIATKCNLGSSTPPPPPEVEEVPPVIPRSIAAPPVKLDRSITAAILQITTGDGRSNLQVIAQQGQLGDLLNERIWAGRRDEMEQVWSCVPHRYRNQVDIEILRGKLERTRVVERFATGKSDWRKGF